MSRSKNPLRRWFRQAEEPLPTHTSQREGRQAEENGRASTEKALAYLDRIRQKMERLADNFAAGRVNATQFKELYTHYQQERRMIEQTLEEAPAAAAWRATVAEEEGESGVIRRRHAARILGYAIYPLARSTALHTVGGYDVEEPLIQSVLDTIHHTAAEERQMRSIEVEDGHWVGFVPGEHTILVVFFSIEPARGQLDLLRTLQTHFERANRNALARGIHDPAKLVFPHAAVFE